MVILLAVGKSKRGKRLLGYEAITARLPVLPSEVGAKWGLCLSVCLSVSVDILCWFCWEMDIKIEHVCRFYQLSATLKHGQV